MANIVLIGMPGCGKSTVGVLLASALHMDFVDTDIVLQEQQGKKLQTIIDAVGNDAFLKIEEDCICGLEYNNTVIATGGSVVYGKKAMRHLHENGLVVYIRLPYEEIERRLSNLATRGVTLKKGQTLHSLYDERIPLYEAEADYVFDAEKLCSIWPINCPIVWRQTMNVEIWDLYDAQGEKTGKTMIRGEAIPVGFYHIGVHIWPMNDKGELLIQRRSMGVQWKPGIWAVTGGSAVSGEEPLTAARRELREELGYAASKADMLFVSRLRRSNSYCYVYAVKTNWAEDDFTLQKEEVSAVRWCSPQRLMQMVSEGSMYNYGDAYYRMLFDFQKDILRA